MDILLVEDDDLIGNAICVALTDAAYAVDWVKDGISASRTLEVGEYRAVILDLGLPKRDGLEVLRLLRQNKNLVPTIIITARDSVKNRITGLDMGADDYISKPLDIDELLARLRSIFRRQSGQVEEHVLSNGVFSLDLVSRKTHRGDVTHSLPTREFALLRALLLHPGMIFSRTKLEERIYAWNEEVESNAVEFLIHSIRKKVGKDAIKNVRGAGWMVDKS